MGVNLGNSGAGETETREPATPTRRRLGKGFAGKVAGDPVPGVVAEGSPRRLRQRTAWAAVTGRSGPRRPPTPYPRVEGWPPVEEGVAEGAELAEGLQPRVDDERVARHHPGGAVHDLDGGLGPGCASPGSPAPIGCRMKVVLPVLYWPTRSTMGLSGEVGVQRGRVELMEVAVLLQGQQLLRVQLPQPLGHRLEELRPLLAGGILADPAEHAAGHRADCCRVKGRLRAERGRGAEAGPAGRLRGRWGRGAGRPALRRRTARPAECPSAQWNAPSRALLWRPGAWARRRHWGPRGTGWEGAGALPGSSAAAVPPQPPPRPGAVATSPVSPPPARGSAAVAEGGWPEGGARRPQGLHVFLPCEILAGRPTSAAP